MHATGRKWLRRAKVVVVFAVIGLLVSVAAAWLSAAFIAFPGSLQQSRHVGLSSREWWLTRYTSTWGGRRYQSIVMPRAHQYEESDTLGQLPAWAQLPAPRTTGAFGNHHNEIADARGWPIPCLYSRFSATRSINAKNVIGTVHGGISLGQFQDSVWYDPRVLPLTPIWWALAVDTLFWGVLAALLICGVPAVVRYWRHRHGRCVGCGYDLRGALQHRCPECGVLHRRCPECGLALPPVMHNAERIRSSPQS